MKKLAIVAVSVITVILIVTGVFYVRARTLTTRFVSESIFIPEGVCDEYKSDALREETTMWKYKLSDEEQKAISAQLDKSPWVSASSYEFGPFLPEDYYPEGLSENLYYCIYALGADEFDNFNRNFPIINESRILFLYDADAGVYYCFLAAI